MQLSTVYLYLQTTLHVSGGIATHHQALISLYLQYLVLLRPLLQPVMSVTGCLIVVLSHTNLELCKNSSRQNVTATHFVTVAVNQYIKVKSICC